MLHVVTLHYVVCLIVVDEHHMHDLHCFYFFVYILVFYCNKVTE
jgi:hypothetical protein